MIPLKATLILLLTCHLAAAAAPRVALVRIRDIFTTLPSSIQEDMKNEQEAIKTNERVGQLNKIVEELKVLQAQLEEISRQPNAAGKASEGQKNDKTDKTQNAGDRKQPDQTNIRELARNYEMKRQEAQTLSEDFEAFKMEREKALKRKMVVATRASLDRIVETSQKIAKEKGFEILIDSTGATNTGAPFILYSKDAIDLTDDIQAALKASEPAASATPAAAAPEPAATPATKP